MTYDIRYKAKIDSLKEQIEICNVLIVYYKKLDRLQHYRKKSLGLID